MIYLMFWLTNIIYIINSLSPGHRQKDEDKRKNMSALDANGVHSRHTNGEQKKEK